MLAPDVANMYPHKIPFRRQSFGSSGTAFAAPWSRFPPFGTPHGPPRSPVSSLRSGSLKVPASAALRNFRIVPSAKPSGIRPPLTQPRHQPSGPWSEKFVTKRQPLVTPHISGSYRLRRHFPRHCDVSTRAEHPYRPRFLPRDSLSTGSSPSGKRNFYSESQDLRVSGGRTLAPPRTCGCYQLAFVTPGISPFEAISRNWIRLMPNRRM